MKLRVIRWLLKTLILLGLLWGVGGQVYAQSAEAGVFAGVEVRPQTRFEVPVEVRGVENLYAIDLELRFNPAILQAEDANPGVDGVQPALGTFLDAGLTLFNSVDNETGVVRFAMSQANPSEAKSGDGVILVLNFVAVGAGESDLTISLLEASDRMGDAIVLQSVEATVRVAAEAPEMVATAIPVQGQEGLIAVPTLAPTPTTTQAPPTQVPTETLSNETETNEAVAPDLSEKAAYPVVVLAEPEAVESVESVATPVVVEQAAVEAENSVTILDYWWAVLIVVVLAVGLAVYYFKFHQK